MMQNVVAGCVAVALIILALIGFAQTHHECWHGHVLLTHEPCGSVSPSI
jgi:hypothetical protein